ncbi:conserved hypothetical protein [Leishmania braziliensis MHOM/BR/75/M2904]|uniref:Uncharacterized protein n=1 Tax=Leishmania braziliensis TaxID=5660 RepID=A4HHK4_LEIBR|nr:conserved hypothetical protein [Leishmania braziliensis MHOM/BR/75/M2904]CAJ2476686.1 unnamed protein product [Leishmania braziliensis]CAM40058.1 conserved hypothetical protein [Leishmania braziliensis MHOM/BR/75/M2904]
MGGALCTRQAHASNDRALFVTPQSAIRNSENLLSDAMQERTQVTSANPLDTLSVSQPPTLQYVKTSSATHSVRSHEDTTVHRSSASDGQHSTLHHGAQPLLSSSLLSNQLSTQTPSHGASKVMAASPAKAVPRSASPIPEMETSLSSSRSLFSLYSADSCSDELPLPPLQPAPPLQAAETRAMASATLTEIPNTTAQYPSATSNAPFMKKSILSNAADLPKALPVTPMPAMRNLVPENDSRNNGCTVTSSHDKTPEIDSAQAAPKALSTWPSNEAAAAAAHAVSSALLEVSFDSRALAVSDATTFSEIQRIANRLRELQDERQVLGEALQVCGLPSPSASADNSVVRTQPSVSEASKVTSEALPVAPTALLESSQRSFESLSSESVLASRQFYNETAKFLNSIREIHEAGKAGQGGCAWFRCGAAPPSTNSPSGGGCGEVETPSDAVTRTSPPPAVEAASFSGTQRDDAPVGGAVSDLRLLISLRRRCRTSTCVRWLPFEVRESDLRTGSVITPVCTCGDQAANAFAYDTGATHSSEHFPVKGVDLVTACLQHVPERGASSVTTPSVVGNSPLPSGVSFTGLSSPLGQDAEKESTAILNDSQGPLSSSAGITTSTSAHSISSDNLSLCPVHAAHRPVSILISKKGRRSASSISFSLAQKQPLKPLQVAVPTTATTESPTPKLASALLPPFDLQHPTNDRPTSESGRRPIINSGVPYRKQLAKRALEDNKLFFEILSRQRSLS